MLEALPSGELPRSESCCGPLPVLQPCRVFRWDRVPRLADRRPPLRPLLLAHVHQQCSGFCGVLANVHIGQYSGAADRCWCEARLRVWGGAAACRSS